MSRMYSASAESNCSGVTSTSGSSAPYSQAVSSVTGMESATSSSSSATSLLSASSDRSEFNLLCPLLLSAFRWRTTHVCSAHWLPNENSALPQRHDSRAGRRERACILGTILREGFYWARGGGWCALLATVSGSNITLLAQVSQHPN